ncbi:hypothetical protein BgAZ_208960 [Babesia gibsoni]|uniref:Phosphatidylinositol N-acetylglucosaminyltransferase subunit H conserved domain-containing protein n=1 Tax=Babesia gibsoni TaxID=33632 RepID=A0AAD8PET7_BABGI|nr:hypothetical protein BgAZ_208960 [Babesia gibsoni]
MSTERLIFLKGYGLQIESRRWNGGKSVRGIPIGDVQFLLINEVMFLDDVTFYMAIILKDTEEIILPFQNAIPRLKNLKMIYRTFNEMFPDHSRYVAPETELLSMQ